MDDATADAAANSFEASTIDQILSRSATIRYDPSSGRAQGLPDGAPGAEGDASSSAPAPRRALNLSKATFAVDDSDRTLDVNDASFWEKVLGPKPAETLLGELSSDLLADPEKTAQFVADLTALLDDVFESRCNGDPHDASETVNSILIELSILGKTTPHPLSPAGMARRSAATGGQVAHPLPPPSPAVTTVLGDVAMNASRQRTAAAAGHGPLPEVDGDGTQHDGTIEQWARYWGDRLEQGRRMRKRASTAGVPLASGAVAASGRGRGRGRGGGGGGGGPTGRPRGRPPKNPIATPMGEGGFEGGGGEGEGDADGDDAPAGKRRRGPNAAPEEPEREASMNGLPSISHIRVRLSRLAGATPVLQSAAPSSSPDEPAVSPTAPEYLGAEGEDGSMQPPTATLPPFDPSFSLAPPELVAEETGEMPARLFSRTGPSRADVLAAAERGVSAELYVRDPSVTPEAFAALVASRQRSAAGGEDGAAPVTSTLSPALLAPQPGVQAGIYFDPLAVEQDGARRTKKLAAWHMMNRASKAAAAAPVLRAPASSDDGAGLIVTPEPLRVVVAYTTNNGRVLRPYSSKGQSRVVPAWIAGGRPVDSEEEEKRAVKRAQAAVRAAERAAFRKLASDVGGEGGGNNLGSAYVGDDDLMDGEAAPPRGGAYTPGAPVAAAYRPGPGAPYSGSGGYPSAPQASLPPHMRMSSSAHAAINAAHAMAAVTPGGIPAPSPTAGGVTLKLKFNAGGAAPQQMQVPQAAGYPGFPGMPMAGPGGPVAPHMGMYGQMQAPFHHQQ